MNYTVLSAAGNTFAVVDAVHGEAPRDPERTARELCEAGASHMPGLRLDGLLLVRPPAGEGDCRMEIYNADGSRPKACGNGLRCVARFARERGLGRSDLVRVETDAGLRRVQLAREHDRIVAARATMGVPRLDGLEVELETPLGSVSATLIDMGNPHCVIFVPDVREAPVGELGPILERHPRFPQRTNVEFVTPRAHTAGRRGRIAARVWERGVGETTACGT
ncbi:MAG TPA: diaminopimelate epimerase, partial [Planctomycetota bacterium]|nr:diaminopimelate epimerase [Planctomycetota bacterium]